MTNNQKAQEFEEKVREINTFIETFISELSERNRVLNDALIRDIDRAALLRNGYPKGWKR